MAILFCGTAKTASAQAKAQTATTLAITASGSAVTTVNAGSVVALTATVKAGATPVAAGQVNFCDASAKYCTDVHVVGTAQLTSSGTAVWRFRPGSGSFSYKAVFAGTNTQEASTSSKSSLTVTGTPVEYATATAITESGSWGHYSLSATVAESGGKAVPTGTASFLDTSNGGAVLATADFGIGTAGVNWINSQTAKVGFRPYSVAAGDFNGDGIADLAVANFGDGTVSILLGKGDGTFAATSSPLSAPSVGYLAVSDFNGDGKLDIAVTADSDATTLSVFLGNGDGTFAQTASPTVVQYAIGLTVADFNGDGFPDIVLAAPNIGAYTVLLGKGDGTFTSTQVTVSQQGCYEDVASADFNGDGKIDLVLTSGCEYNQGNPVVILLGNGDGTFTAGSTPRSVDEPGRVVIGDFNGDGHPDLAVVVDDGSASLDVFLNNGDGTFTVHYFGSSIPQHGGSLALGDVNGDGIADLVLPNVYGNNLWTFTGNGDGTFTQSPVTPATGDIPEFAAMGDFNGDGSADVATANSFDSTVTVLLSKPTQSTTATAENVAISAPGLHNVDSSYSGDPNYGASVSGKISLWGVPPATVTTLALTSGGKAAATVVEGSLVTLTAAVKAGANLLTTGEVDFCDASATKCTDIHLFGRAQLTSSGSAAYTFAPGIGAHIYKAQLVQNGAGLASASDAVALTVTAKTGVIYPTVSTIAQSGTVGNYTLTATVTETGGTVAPTGAVSFLDTSYNNAVAGTAMLGAATPGLAWTNSQTPATGSGPLNAVAADFDRDGNVDLAVLNQADRTITILLGKGDGTFLPATASVPAGSQPLTIITSDFNHDGIADLAVAENDSVGTVLILLGKGDGSFTPVATSATLGQPAYSLVAGDFNGDGIQDMVVAADAPNGVAVLIGKGDGTFTKISPGAASNLATYALVTEDLNGDGILDLVGYSASFTINAYLGNGDGTFRAGGSVPFDPDTSYIALADVNRDGKLDIVVTNSAQESITVFLGNGDGSFSQTGITTYTQQITGQYICVADFNGDGVPDVAVSTGNWIMPVLLGNGDGTFTETSQVPSTSGIYVYATNIVVADFNGDGRPDIAGLEQGSNAVTVQLTQLTETASASTSTISLSGPTPHLVDASYAGDNNDQASVSDTTSLDVQAATPVITPASGTYTSVQTATISVATPGVTIYYSTDGSLPSPAYSHVYTGPITVASHRETLQAIAVEVGYEQSSTAAAIYTLNLQAPVAPVLSLASGVYAKAQTVTISDATPGAVIYYTTNGSIPAMSSAQYAGPIAVSTSETVVAIAANGYATSPAVSGQYIISSVASRFVYTIAGNGQFGYSGDSGPATTADLNYPQAAVLDAAGNLYISDEFNNVVRKVAAGTGIITTFAGDGIGGYTGDGGPAASAELSDPIGLALDSAGNLYIADSANHVIRKVTAATGVISTFAGTGIIGDSGDSGPATAATLGFPQGITIDAHGNLYLSQESGNVVRKIAASTGTITTVAGSGNGGGYAGDGGPATAAILNGPNGLTVDGAGNLFIADAYNNVIRKVTASTGTISTVVGKTYNYASSASAYSGDGGPATSATLYHPSGVTMDGAGNLYIADSYNSVIREVTASTGIITTIAGSWNPNFSCTSMGGDAGPATSSALCAPTGVAIDKTGNVYITDTAHGRIREVTPAAVPPSTQAEALAFSVSAGTYGAPQILTLSDKTPGAAIYLTLDGSQPTGASQIYSGPINVSGSVTIRALAAAPGLQASSEAPAAYTITSQPAEIISTVAGNGASGVAGDAANGAQFGWLGAIARNSAGDLYIADTDNYVIWKLAAATGEVSMVAGTGEYGYAGDGGQATSALLSDPQGVAVDGAGNLYIGDTGNNVIREVTVSTGVITTIAGTHNPGYPQTIGDGGPATAAVLRFPEGIALDAAGNLYIADDGDDEVRKVSAATGIITSAAGNGSYGSSGDGGKATSASVASPREVTVDAAGNLYITTWQRATIRKVSASTGIINTIAGNGQAGSSGDDGPALNAEIDPLGLAVDASGNLYLSNGSATIREVVAATGKIQRFAGNGYFGFSGDGGSATIAELDAPQGVALASDGSLYVADAANYRIRKVTPASAESQTAAPAFSVPAATYTAVQTVTITDTTPGASIYYTVDGSTPTIGSSVYSSPIIVAKSETLKAIATAAGYTQSAVTNAAYTIQQLLTPTVTITPSAESITTTQAVSVTVAVSGATGHATPTGQVTLASGSYITTQTLASGSTTFNLAAGTLPAGADSLTATYAPDTASAATYTSGAQSVTITVSAPGSASASVTVTPSAVAITDQQSLSVKVAVSGASGEPAPTGSLTLTSGSYTATQTLNGGTTTLQIPAEALAAGTNTLTANYSGDATYSAVSGTATVILSAVVITPPAPALVSPGGNATGTLTLTAGSNYSGTLNLSCSLTASPAGAQSLPTCNLSPTSVPVAAGKARTSTLTIHTTAGSNTALLQPHTTPMGWLGRGGASLALILLFGLPAKRRRWILGLGLALMLVPGFAIGCGGGGQSSTSPPATPATTAGSYIFTLTGTDASNEKIAISAQVTLTVE